MHWLARIPKTPPCPPRSQCRDTDIYKRKLDLEGIPHVDPSGSNVWGGQPVYPEESDDSCIFPDGGPCPAGPVSQRRSFVYVWKTWGEELPSLIHRPHLHSLLPTSSPLFWFMLLNFSVIFVSPLGSFYLHST